MSGRSFRVRKNLHKIVGLIFVVKTGAAAEQLVFRFPNVIRKQVSEETLSAFDSHSGKDKKVNLDGFKRGSFTNEHLQFRQEEQQDLEIYQPFNLPSVILAPQLVPKIQLFNKIFQFYIENTLFLGYPMMLVDPTVVSGKERENLTSSGKGQTDSVVAFNVCLALGKIEDSSVDVLPNGIGSLKQFKIIVKNIAFGLEQEEKRCKYVSQQVMEMLAIREAWLIAQKADIKPDHNALTSQLLSVGQLARELRDIFFSLRDHGSINTRFNGGGSVICSLRDPADIPSIPIRPYQTLLLLPNFKKSGTLPPDSSPALRKLIELSTPLKSFRDLQVELEIPLSYLYRLVAHLVFWNYAKVINTLSKANIYVLNHKYHSMPNRQSLRSLHDDFQLSFPSFRFDELLERFSRPEPLGGDVDVMSKSLGKDFVDAVVWLLQRNLLVQLNTYIFLVIPKGPMKPQHRRNNSDLDMDHDELNEATESSHHGMNNNNGTLHNGFATPLYATSPIPLTPEELAYLDSIPDKGIMYQQFLRLCPYFRGRHHIEEILWRENISREDLFKIVNKYENLLVMATHEGFEH